MYLSTDLRSTLATKKAAKPILAFKDTDLLKFHEAAPVANGGEPATRYGRGQNFVVAYTNGQAGETLSRADQQDEYFLILPDAETEVEVTAGGETATVPGYSIAILPPGPSRVTIKRPGTVVRLFTTLNRDLADLAENAANYATPDLNVAEYRAWPEPKGGFKLRVYSLDVPVRDDRFGRIWRSTNFMINVFYPQGPRDITKLSPHHHDDFQQGSLMLSGECVHHIRWPWLPDMTTWKEDEHVRCQSPSLMIIPPPAIHTTRMLADENVLIDIFSPPREDFSLKEGWVLNADDYPMPDAT